MTTNYRALCSQLLDVIDNLPCETNYKNESRCAFPIDEEVVSRARLALNQPEPEGLTDEGIQRIALSLPATCDWSPEHTHWTKSWNVSLTGLLIFARAVISEMPTALAQPEPEGLTHLAEDGLNALRNQIITSQADYDALFAALSRLASLENARANPKVPTDNEIISCMFKGHASISKLEPTWINRHGKELIAGVRCVLDMVDRAPLAQPEPQGRKPAPNYDRVSEIATAAQTRAAAQHLITKKHCDGDLIPAIIGSTLA